MFTTLYAAAEQAGYFDSESSGTLLDFIGAVEVAHRRHGDAYALAMVTAFKAGFYLSRPSIPRYLQQAVDELEILRIKLGGR